MWFVRAVTSYIMLAVTMEAAAHDFWLQPETYRPVMGARLNVGLFVGDGFPGEPVPRNPERIVKFVAVGPAGESNILGVSGRAPAGVLKPTVVGMHILGYRSNHAFITLEAAKFEEYLKAEGLEQIAALRAERGETAQPGRERYSRCAKAIVHVTGAAPAAAPATSAAAPPAYDHTLGFTLELLPEQDPATLKPGDALSVRLMHEGKPLPGALVRAATTPDATTRTTARTDADGRAKLTLAHAGVWRIAATHMYPMAPGGDVDWESVWTSLTFEVGAAQGR